MCIIIYKPTGIENPTWSTLQTCFNSNPHGAGFMYAENGRVYIEKGFMTWTSFKKAFKPFKNRTDLPLAIHFRITTHGGTEQGLTHPFPLTSNVNELKSTKMITNVGIAHNGFIALTDYADKGMSDTSEFVRKYANVIITSPKWYNNPNANKLLAEVIGSKMLVLSNDGHGEVVGDGWIEENGVMYSNDSFKSLADWYGCYDWDDYGNVYEGTALGTTPTYCKHWFEYDGKTQRKTAPKECDGCIERTWCWG